MKKYYSAFIFFCLFFLIAHQAKAEVFVVHLFYDAQAQNLRFDKIQPQPISYDKNTFLSITDFLSNQTPGDYMLNLYDSEDNLDISTEFRVQNGAFDFTLPYFSSAKTLEIFDKKTGEKILSADLSDFSTCNNNGICEFEKGETGLNCIGDCASSNINYSPQTLEKLKENSGVIKDQTTGETLLRGSTTASTASSKNIYVIIIVALIITLPLCFYAYKKFIKNKN